MYKNQGDPCNNTIIVLVKSIFKSVHKQLITNSINSRKMQDWISSFIPSVS